MSKHTGLEGWWRQLGRQRTYTQSGVRRLRRLNGEQLESRCVLAPFADAGGFYFISEGQDLVLDGSASLDGENGPLTYYWGINPDRGECDPGASPTLCDTGFDFAEGRTVTITWSQLNAVGIVDASFDQAFVTLKVVDQLGGESTAYALLSVADLIEFATFTVEPADAGGCGGSTVTLNATIVEPNPLEMVTSVSVIWDLLDSEAISEPLTFTDNGDGTFTVAATHTYSSPGFKLPVLFVNSENSASGRTDEMGVGFLTSGVANPDFGDEEIFVEITGGGNETGSVELIGNVLHVTGTCLGDWVHINLPAGNLRVQASFLETPVAFPAASVQAMIVLLGSGDDTLTVAGNVAIPLVAVGGDGSDTMTASRGGSILIGGRGQDFLYGGRGEDLLIGGYTSFDADAAALLAILAEWTNPAHSLEDRIRNLVDGSGSLLGLNESGGYYITTIDRPLSEQTVFDDGEANVLGGGAGSDWLILGHLDQAISNHRDLIGDDLDDLFGP